MHFSGMEKEIKSNQMKLLMIVLIEDKKWLTYSLLTNLWKLHGSKNTWTKITNGKWKYFFENELEKYGGTIVFGGNLNKNDTIENLKFNSCFMNEILSIWSEVNFEEHITSEEKFLEQSLWYNSLVRIGSRPIFYREWFDSGITKVKDLKDGFNNFLSLAQLQHKYNFNVCPLKYNGLLSALKSVWNTCKNNCVNTGNSNYENFATN